MEIRGASIATKNGIGFEWASEAAATGESYRLKDARRQREDEADEADDEEPSPPDSSQ